MKKINLCRPEESFNKNSAYKIFIGEKNITELKNGAEKTIEVPSELENNPLKAKIKWCGSQEIELRNIAENEKVVVSGNEFFNKKMSLFGAIFPLIGLILFNLKIVSKNTGVLIFILFLIAIIGTMTIWKNKWLNLKTEELLRTD